MDPDSDPLCEVLYHYIGLFCMIWKNLSLFKSGYFVFLIAQVTVWEKEPFKSIFSFLKLCLCIALPTKLCCCCCCSVASVVSDSVRPHRRQPTRLSHPWDSPGKNTGVGCHVLLQCMKVKSESEVAQSCLTPCNPMDCSLPGSSVHGIFQARVLEWGAVAFSTTKL